MKRILVIADPAGGDQPALLKAQSLARLTSAEVHIVAICYEHLSWLDSGQGENRGENAREQILAREQRWWQDYIAAEGGISPAGVEVVWQKYPLEWILEHCRQHHYDLLIKSGHRSETLLHTPLDWLLLRESEVPVYLLSREPEPEPSCVLAALDLMAQSPEKQALNERLLEAAFRIAVATGTDLHCCFVISIAKPLQDLGIIDAESHARSVERQARKRAESLLDCYDLDRAHVHIRSGVAWKVIASLSAELRAGCIVIGTMGRKGLTGKFFGNTSEQVIHVARRDLLVIGQSAAG